MLYSDQLPKPPMSPQIYLQNLELETERLRLRPFIGDDAPIMYALNEDPEVLQYTGDKQFANILTARTFFENYDQYGLYGVGRMTTILKETGEILGWCGLKYHPDSAEYDIGYRFFKKYWGKGYGTESATAILRKGFTKPEITRIIARVRIENIASIHVLEKLGLIYQYSYEENHEQWMLYQISAPQED